MKRLLSLVLMFSSTMVLLMVILSSALLLGSRTTYHGNFSTHTTTTTSEFCPRYILSNISFGFDQMGGRSAADAYCLPIKQSLLCTVVIISIVSGAVALFSLQRRNLRRLLSVLFVFEVGSFIVGVIIGAQWSLGYWNYAFYPPALDTRLKTVARVVEFSDHRQKQIDKSGICELERKVDPEYPFDGRAVRLMCETGRLSGTEPDVSGELVTRLMAALRDRNFFVKSEPGYSSDRQLSWQAIRFISRDEREYIFLEIKGGQVSNDHFPFYEVTAEITEGDTPQIVQSKHFFFDVAGWENISWESVACVTAASGILLSSLVLLAWCFLSSVVGFPGKGFLRTGFVFQKNLLSTRIFRKLFP